MPTLAPIDVGEELAAAGEVVAPPPQQKQRRDGNNAMPPAALPQKKQPRQSSPPRGVPAAVSSETLDDDAPQQQAAASAQSDKKRKRSVLEALGAGDERGGDANAVGREKATANAAASDANAGSKKKAPKKTIRDFYSLSPKVDFAQFGGSETTPVPTGSSSKLTPKSTATKKRVVGKFVALHDEAKPIHVRIPFAGEAKPTEVVIDSHCVDPKSFASEKPIELSGSYNPRTRKQMQRFLIGFGRYIH